MTIWPLPSHSKRCCFRPFTVFTALQVYEYKRVAVIQFAKNSLPQPFTSFTGFFFAYSGWNLFYAAIKMLPSAFRVQPLFETACSSALSAEPGGWNRGAPLSAGTTRWAYSSSVLGVYPHRGGHIYPPYLAIYTHRGGHLCTPRWV